MKFLKKNSLIISSALIVTCFFTTSCGQNNIEDDKSIDHLKKAMHYFTDYISTKNNAYLDSSYSELIQDYNFKTNGITDENKYYVTPIFMHLKKYDELEYLLEKYSPSDTLGVLENNITINIVKCLKKPDKCNIYIGENLKYLSNELIKHPLDSMLYTNFFHNRMYLIGKESTLKEIDSIKKINKIFSDDYYNYLLKESIEEYPEDLLPLNISKGSKSLFESSRDKDTIPLNIQR